MKPRSNLEKEKTLSERIAADTMSDNTQFPKCEQCKACIFRDKTSWEGKECGWEKSICEMYPYPKWKPHSVVYGKEPCEFYEKEKQWKR